ncbi:conserved membrane protein of unknown function [uncultured Woeseiaceae bacterium]|uniref:Acyltransferase 3 domain-containing protein n=1 Tax=uncultured Woeseiaceae bacterium TaxID=1983305 RepID=A0A7D9H5T7_9GAMM|nr:conserved membrane protein of unknown function [uncultured Woeseiaceae bacterium]
MSVSSLDQNISERITLMCYPMIYLIMLVDVPRIIGYIDDPNMLTFIGSFVTDGLMRLGVPVLACFSGFLVFHNALDSNFPLLMRKGFVSLVTPLLIWNIPVALALYVVQSQGLIEYDFADGKTMYPFDLMIWLNRVLSVTYFPIIYPMNFLRDLFVVCFFAPWMGMLIRNFPFVGLIALLAVFIPNLDGFLILNNEIIIMFYVGGMAATMNWDLKRLDRYAVPLVCLLLLICVIVVVMGAGHPFWLSLLGPFILWPVSSMFVGTPTGRWLTNHCRAGIFLFMVHGLMLLTVKATFSNLYGREYAFHVWLITPVLIAIASQFIYLFLDKFFPRFLIVLIGGHKPTAAMPGK